MTIPQPTFGPNGFVIPTESAILEAVQEDLNAAFGGDLNPALETPQGQMASTLTAVIGDKNDQFVALTNGVDPAYAAGRMQDGIARIYFIERHPAQPTVVTANCTGLPGVIIPYGAIAIADDGNLYLCTGATTIPSSGTASVVFSCSVTGPNACPTGSLDTIYQAIPGWDTITNPGDGVIGSVVESRADFEFRRSESVAANSVGSVQAIRGSVLSVADVLDAYVTENPTGAPVTIGGVSIAANSLYVAVAGGASADVARAIWLKKAPGCGYVGNTTVTVYDDNPGYPPPGIPYTVLFQIPDPLAIYFTVQLADNPGIPADAAVQIQNTIVLAFAGADGGPRARIGSPIFASRFYAGIARLGTWAEILSVLVGSTNTIGVLFTGSITGTLLTVTGVGSGALAVGQPLFGTSIAPATIITALGSGVGGVGTYVVSISQTVGSESMGGLTMGNTITTQIDQVPTIVNYDVFVSVV